MNAVTVPGFRKGAVGCTVGLGAIIIIPIAIIATVRAKKLIQAAAYKPAGEELHAIVQLHLLRVVCSVLMLSCGISEWVLKLAAAKSSLRAKSM